MCWIFSLLLYFYSHFFGEDGLLKCFKQVGLQLQKVENPWSIVLAMIKLSNCCMKQTKPATTNSGRWTADESSPQSSFQHHNNTITLVGPLSAVTWQSYWRLALEHSQSLPPQPPSRFQMVQYYYCYAKTPQPQARFLVCGVREERKSFWLLFHLSRSFPTAG